METEIYGAIVLGALLSIHVTLDTSCWVAKFEDAWKEVYGQEINPHACVRNTTSYRNFDAL